MHELGGVLEEVLLKITAGESQELAVPSELSTTPCVGNLTHAGNRSSPSDTEDIRTNKSRGSMTDLFCKPALTHPRLIL